MVNSLSAAHPHLPMILGSYATYGHAGMPLHPPTMSWVVGCWPVPSQQQPPMHLPPASGKSLVAKNRSTEMTEHRICVVLKAQGYSLHTWNLLCSMGPPLGAYHSRVLLWGTQGNEGYWVGQAKGSIVADENQFHVNFTRDTDLGNMILQGMA